jgi:hypothetical protein
MGKGFWPDVAGRFTGDIQDFFHFIAAVGPADAPIRGGTTIRALVLVGLGVVPGAAQWPLPGTLGLAWIWMKLPGRDSNLRPIG